MVLRVVMVVPGLCGVRRRRPMLVRPAALLLLLLASCRNRRLWRSRRLLPSGGTAAVAVAPGRHRHRQRWCGSVRRGEARLQLRLRRPPVRRRSSSGRGRRHAVRHPRHQAASGGQRGRWRRYWPGPVDVERRGEAHHLSSGGGRPPRRWGGGPAGGPAKRRLSGRSAAPTCPSSSRSAGPAAAAKARLAGWLTGCCSRPPSGTSGAWWQAQARTLDGWQRQLRARKTDASRCRVSSRTRTRRACTRPFVPWRAWACPKVGQKNCQLPAHSSVCASHTCGPSKPGARDRER